MRCARASLTELPGAALEDRGGTSWLASAWVVMLLHRLPASRRRKAPVSGVAGSVRCCAGDAGRCWAWTAIAAARASASVARAKNVGPDACMTYCSFVDVVVGSEKAEAR